jgi:starch synthase (maltosyl-transferring)
MPSLSRIIIENVYPELDGGRYPVKREVGELFEVWADIFMDGHDLLKAGLLYRADHEKQWNEVALQPLGNDRWHGAFFLEDNTRYHYTLRAWEDPFGSWARDTQKKIAAGQDIALEVEEGRQLALRLLDSLSSRLRKQLKATFELLENAERAELEALLLGEELPALLDSHGERCRPVTYERELEVVADRTRARFSAWYEVFPRSQGQDATRSGTFDDCIRRLPDIRAMGFDVLYLTPIHPIGRVHRKGKNNSLIAEENDPGSPYAVSNHKEVHPELGTLADFRRFVKATQEHGMEIALDFAIQCAPDHVYVQEHPEWFVFRPDGSIKYAENPPKKYQDIVNVNFQCEAWESLWEELRSIVLFWVGQGVRIFRVDNPHTKPFAFWEWMIGSVQKDHPDVIFLSEAFTRPKVMYLLAKAGFTQSYTYFTWRNTATELTEYLTELATDWPKDYFRPNFFANTPDILPPHLQTGGRPVFMIRAALAATLAASYGIYSGFELCEGQALPGKEEYLDSEKYEIKPRDWHAPGNIRDFITRLNTIRNENPALHHLRNLRFYPSSNAQVLFYGKRSKDDENAVFVAVNLDPHHAHESYITLPLAELGIAEHEPYQLENLLEGHRWQWTGSRQHQLLRPEINPVAIFRLVRKRP